MIQQSTTRLAATGDMRTPKLDNMVIKVDALSQETPGVGEHTKDTKDHGAMALRDVAWHRHNDIYIIRCAFLCVVDEDFNAEETDASKERPPRGKRPRSGVPVLIARGFHSSMPYRFFKAEVEIIPKRAVKVTVTASGVIAEVDVRLERPQRV
jgi:hypothetical protein